MTDIAVFGVQLDGGQAVGEAARVDKALDAVGESAESAEKKLKALGDSAGKAGEELGGIGDGARGAGDEIDRTNPKVDRSRSSLGGMAVSAAAAMVVLETLGSVVSVFTGFLSGAIDNSDRASAALDRMTAAGDTLKAATGDALAPALESVADVLEDIASDPVAVEMFQELGSAIGTVVELIGDALAAFREYATFIGGEVLAVNPFSGISRADVEQARLVLEMERDLARQAYEERQKNRAGAKADADAIRRMEDWVRTLKKQTEERRRAAQQGEREREREEKQLDQLIDRYDTQGATLRKLEADERELTAAIAAERRPVEDLTKALEELRAEREKLIGLPKQGFIPTLDVERDLPDGFLIGDEAARAAERAVERAKEVKIEARSAGDEFFRWADGISAAADMLGGFNSDLGQTLQGLAGVVGMFGQMREMQANGASRGEMAIAGAQMGSQVFGMGRSMGLGWKGQRGKGKFGAEMSGDYSDAGSMVGGAIGSIWGPVGSLVGSVIGGALGGAIKSGADEGIVHIKSAAGEASRRITANEGGLGHIVTGIADDIISLTEDIASSLGGRVTGIAEMDIKVRDDIVSVIINGYAKRFENIDEAIAYAVGEAMKRSEISGMDDMIRAGLQRADSSSLEAFQSDVETLNTILGFGLGEAAMSAKAMTAELDVLRNSAERLLVGTEELGRAMEYLSTEEARRWDNLRDQITGDTDSPAEIAKEREQDRLMYNAERALRIADLQARRQELAAQLQILQGRETLAEARIRIDAYELDQTSKIMDQEIKLLGQFSTAAAYATGVSIETVQAQIAALDQLIAAMPPEIRPGDMKPLGGRGGGAGGLGDFGRDFGRITGRWESMTNKWADAQKNLLDGLTRIALGEATTALTGAEQSALAKAELDALIARAKRGDVEAVGELDEAFSEFASTYKEFTGGGSGFLGDFRDVFQGYFDELQRIGTMDRPGRTRSQNVVFDERFHRGQERQLDEQRRHRAENREGLRAVAMAVNENTAQARELNAHLRREGRPYRVER